MHDEKKSCYWKEDEDGNWSSACGSLFVFLNGGPNENDFGYCPYCGGLLHEMKTTSKGENT